VKFYYDGQGFLSVQLKQGEAKIVFYDIFGKVLHNFDLSKEFYSTM
jgi:tartrate-resistant acid phosphatase type 5